MKTRNFILLAGLILLFSGCVVYSFYPLYTEKDLFPNDILTGTWVDEDGDEWVFEHSYSGEKIPENMDSTSYDLTFRHGDKKLTDEGEFSVHIIQLGGHYFLDFYLEDMN